MALRDSALNIVISARDLTGNALGRLRRRLQDTDGAAERASRSMGDLVKRVAALASAALGLTALTRAMVNMLKTGDEFERLGITMESLMGSIEEGDKATAWVKAFTQNTPHQLTEVSDAFIKLKGFGIDPMNGSLQAMVDQNAKLGRGQENLNGIVLALGQAWAKQKFQGEEILQLVERGVPIWDLLAKATGKNTRELQELSAAGALGRDTIAAVIKEMGAQSTGNAAAAMSLLSGYVSNLKDEWALFQNAIADAGALEFAKDTLRELLTTVQQMKNDGSLATLAKSWSDGLVAVATATVNVAKGIASISWELGVMAKGIGALALVKFLGTLRGLAAGLIGVGAGATTATKAIALMNTVMRATVILGAIELLGRLASAYFDLKTAVEEDEKAQKRLATTLDNANKKAQDNARAVGLQIDSLYAWRGAIAAGVVTLNEQTGAWELNRQAAERLGYELTAQEQQLSALKQRAQELSGPYQALGTAWAEARAEGDDFGEAMAKLLDTADALGTEGIKALALQLKTLEQTGEATKEELVNGLGAALADLSGEDRARFTEHLTQGLQAVDAAGADAVVRLNHMQTLLEANLVAAAATMGVSVQEALTGVDEATDQAVQNLAELVDALQAAGAEGEDASNILAGGFEHVVDTLDSTEEIAAFTDELHRMADEGEISASDLAAALEQVRLKAAELAAETAAAGDAAAGAMDGAGQAASQAGQQAAAMGGIAAAMGNVYEGVHAEIRALSAGAVKAFEHLMATNDLNLDAAEGEVKSLRNEIEDSTAAIEAMAAVGIGDVVGVSQWMKRLRVNAEETKIAYYEQQIAFNQLMDSWDQGGISAQQFIARAQSATDHMGLLDDQDLSTLNAGIEQAKEAMEALKDSTRDTLETLQNELDQLQGKTGEIQKRQHEARKRELQEKLDEANQFGDAKAQGDAREALRLADQIHREKMDNIFTEQQAAKAAAQNSRAAGRDNGDGTRTVRGPLASGTASAPAQRHTIALTLGDKKSEVATDDPEALLGLLGQAGMRTR